MFTVQYRGVNNKLSRIVDLWETNIVNGYEEKVISKKNTKKIKDFQNLEGKRM